MLNQPMMEKLLAMRLQGMVEGEGAGARQDCQRTELLGTTVSAGRSAMGLAREPGAGTETESSQAARAGLRGRQRLSGRAWTG